MPSALFLLLWAITIAVGMQAIVSALRRPERLVELPVLISAMWLYLYGYMALSTTLKMADALPSWSLEVGQALALGALVAFRVGWAWGRKASPRRVVEYRGYSTRTLWWLGLGLIAAGAGAHWTFIGADVVEWESSSGYRYLFFYVGYPGLMLALAAMALDRRYRSLRSVAMLLLCSGVFFYPHVVWARRGPLFAGVVVAALTPSLVAKVVPRRAATLGGLVGVGVAMLLFIEVRPWLYEGSSGAADASVFNAWAEALTELSLSDVVTRHAQSEDDNEYLYHCGLIATAIETGRYQYGTGYLGLVTHWIPRQWWPDKPPLGRGWFPEAVDMIRPVMGWSLSPGASVGGVAETFNQCGLGAIAMWAAMGYAVSVVFRRARRRGDLRWIFAYVGCAGASHWIVTQGMAAAFVPSAVFVLTAVIGARLAQTKLSKGVS